MKQDLDEGIATPINKSQEDQIEELKQTKKIKHCEIQSSYDKSTDVLYLSIGNPVPCISEIDESGLIIRFTEDTHKPSGVTVDRASKWLDKPTKLACEVSRFLKIPQQIVEGKLEEIRGTNRS